MLILDVLLGLKSKQDDVTVIFLHADLDGGKDIFVEIPWILKQEGKVMKSMMTLYFKTVFSRFLEISGEGNGGLWNEAIKVGSLSFCWQESNINLLHGWLALLGHGQERYYDLAMKSRTAGIDLEKEDDEA